MSAHLDQEDLLEVLDIQDQQARLDLSVLQDLQEVKAKLAHLESRALRENLALSALLDRLESVMSNVMLFWSLRTTQLRRMITILVSIAVVQLLFLFPQIAQLVRNLL